MTIALLAPQGSEPSFSADEARRSLELVDQYFDRETDWQRVDQPIGCSDTGGLHQWLREKIGWQAGAARHLVIMVPPGDPCPGWANGEQPGDPDDDGGTFQPGPDPYFLAHELGHNLSLAHALSIRCEAGWDYTPGVECLREEYGNRTEMMGGAWSFLPLSSPSLARLGVLSNVREPVCGDPRIAVLDSLGAGPAASRSLTWTDPVNPDARYWVQYSDKADPTSDGGVTSSPWEADRTVSGVQILRSNPAIPFGGDLLDRPGDTSDANEFVRAGETVALNFGMTVRVDEIDETAHRAAVTVTVPCADPTASRDIAGSARLSASFVPEWSSAAAATDGDDGSVWSSWPMVGEQWLELTWDAPMSIDRVSALVVRDAADDEARGLIPPRGWRVERWDAATDGWVAVDGAVFTPSSRELLTGEVSFDRVQTLAIRLVFAAWGDEDYTGSTGEADVAVFGVAVPVEPQPPVGPQAPTLSSGPVVTGSATGTATGTAGLAAIALLMALAGGGVLIDRRRTV